MKKFGLGLFVKHDINGKEIRVGDTVKITRHAAEWTDIDYGRIEKRDEKVWVGEVRMLLTKGLRIAVKGALEMEYVKVPVSNKSLAKYDWELVKKYDE